MKSVNPANRWFLSARASSTSLFVAVGVMCYLAAMTLGTSLLLLHVTNDWTQEISSRASMRVDVLRGRDTRAAARQVAEMARQDDNILEAALLSREKVDALLKPWLGAEASGENFDLPVLVDLHLRVFDAQALDRLLQDIARQVPGVSLETHDTWRERLARTRHWMLAIAFTALSLIAAVTVMVILLATHVTFANNRSAVELLHLLGARDGDIARAGCKRILTPCLCASVAATFLALATFEALMRIGTGNPLFETAANRGIYAGWLLLVPVAGIAIAMIGARITLMRNLALLSRT